MFYINFRYYRLQWLLLDSLSKVPSRLRWRIIMRTGSSYFISAFSANKKDMSALMIVSLLWGLPYGSAGKEFICSVGDLGLIPGLGRSPGEGKSYPLQYSGLENSMNCVVHGVAKSQTRMSDFHTHTRDSQNSTNSTNVRLLLYGTYSTRLSGGTQ